MSRPRPATFAQLCAIARRVLEPTIDDFEWRERIKMALVAQRLSYPAPHDITAAMERVEHATGSRPVPRPESAALRRVKTHES